MAGEQGSGYQGYVMETHKYCQVCGAHDWLKDGRCRAHQQQEDEPGESEASRPA